MQCWRQTYREVAGLLYHSREEQELAQAGLGLNHPFATIVGTFLEEAAFRRQDQNPRPVRGRYVVYCGRYLRDKGVAMLLEHARRYSASQPGRFTFVFVGEGDVAIPHEAWA